MNKYINPEFEIVSLRDNDVIRTSGEPEDTKDDIDW